MANPFEVGVVNPLQALMIGKSSYDDARKTAVAEKKTAVAENQRSVLAQLLGGGQPSVGGAGPDYNKAAATLAASGDLDGATKLATIGKTISPESSPDIQAFKLAKSQGFQGGIFDFMKEKAAAGATKVTTNNNVSTGGGSDKQIFDSVDESYKAAKATATGLTGLREARTALQGGIISGAGANQILSLQKIGSALGVVDPTAIQNTETFRAAIAPQVAATLKATVGTANISNSDREFAEKAAGGNITLDAGSISRLLNIMERASTAVVDSHNKRLDAIYPNDPKFRRERALFSVQPVEASQQGAAPQRAPIKVSSPEQASKLPSGTQIILPDGSPGVVP